MTMPRTGPRFVILSNGHAFGRSLLAQLKRRNVGSVRTVLVTPSVTPPIGGGTPVRRMARWIREWMRFVPAWRRYRAVGASPVVGGSLHGARLGRALAALDPDYILLGGVGILPPSVLATARRGVINAHPGLLPWVRGTGVVGAALQRGIPVGVTCHLVNAGIDLGDLLERRLLPVRGDESLAVLERRADDLAVEMLADMAGRCAAGNAPRALPQAMRHPICRWLTAAERGAVEAQVAGGLAKRLFDEWMSRSDVDATGHLQDMHPSTA